MMARASSLAGHGCRKQSQQAVSALSGFHPDAIKIHACCILKGCAALTVAVINSRHFNGRNGNSSCADFPLRIVCILLVCMSPDFINSRRAAFSISQE